MFHHKSFSSKEHKSLFEFATLQFFHNFSTKTSWTAISSPDIVSFSIIKSNNLSSTNEKSWRKKKVVLNLETLIKRNAGRTQKDLHCFQTGNTGILSFMLQYLSFCRQIYDSISQNFHFFNLQWVSALQKANRTLGI